MPCPHCASPMTAHQHKMTALGYQSFRCAACRRTFKERTAAPFTFLECPTGLVLRVLYWRYWFPGEFQSNSDLDRDSCRLAEFITSERTWVYDVARSSLACLVVGILSRSRKG